MQNEKIHLERIAKFIKRLKESVHGRKYSAEARYTHNAAEPIPLARLNDLEWRYISCKEIWSQAWGSAWFKVKASVDPQLQGKRIGLFFDCDGEACVYENGKPWQGLTPKVDWYHNAAKYFVPLSDSAVAGTEYELLIEAAANDLFGKGKDSYALRECSLVPFDEEMYQLFIDLEILFDLAKSLPEGSARRAKILYGLNNICNTWAEGSGYREAKSIAEMLLGAPANASALTAYSVGHAHLDLAWLWRIRESKRKGGRTFANALRLLESYPDYIFGASQAQLYSWIKELYPGLYSEVKEQVKQGRWEVQGASWVEFDTNLTGPESIIRQFMYGKAFFKSEFGIEPNYLWLPDCFGFSANLPQFMKGCGVDYFITQKLSWNETNAFPHHLFVWQGIDGSEVRAHQMPTNDYNFSNNPSSFLSTENRFAQSGIADGYLNLYGIGDGGGGPTRNHIEYGLRQRNLEGCPRFRFTKAEEFLRYFDTLEPGLLPRVYGELYLEFHRGTYSTQARMKKQNFLCENKLRAAEVLLALGARSESGDTDDKIKDIWKDTLLLQFHDILPGSSIGPVYQDAFAMGAGNLTALDSLIVELLKSLAGTPDEGCYMVYNSAAGQNSTWLELPLPQYDYTPASEDCTVLACHPQDDTLKVLVRMEPYSIGRINFFRMDERHHEGQEIVPEPDGSIVIQNEHLMVTVSPEGSISSIIDVAHDKELLASESNRLLLWEDEPNNWGAWDINHFYRETTPQDVKSAELLSTSGIGFGYREVRHRIVIGGSEITQSIMLYPGERMIRIKHLVSWQEHHKMLRVSFSPDIVTDYATCGIQMGSVQRSTKARNQWESARFEFPAQGFVDLSDAKKGFSLICPEKYGYSVQENTVEIALLRSPADVDPHADLGSQEYSYAFYCHDKPYAEAKVAEISDAFGTALYSCAASQNLISPFMPTFRFQDGSLIIKHIKPAEDGRGIILRCYEPLGCAVSDWLKTWDRIVRISKCNMLEEEICELDPDQPIQAKPFEIVTLRLEMAP